MKNNNNLLRNIANNTGSNLEPNHSDNYYLKRIEENTRNGSSGGSGFSGDYNDLTNKPTIPSDVSDLTDNSDTTFTPKAHQHTESDITDLGSYISTSDTAGLVKNDGTIDTSTYLTQHQDISGKADKADFDTIEVDITYTDNTTDTALLYCKVYNTLTLKLKSDVLNSYALYNASTNQTASNTQLVPTKRPQYSYDIPYGQYYLKDAQNKRCATITYDKSHGYFEFGQSDFS